MSNSQNEKTAFVLLHGIGPQSHTHTIRNFLSCIAKSVGSHTPLEMSHRTPDTLADGYSYVTATREHKGSNIVISEYFWSDLSELRPGAFWVLTNFFNLVADAPDIIYACLAPNTSGDDSKDYMVLRLLRSIVAFAFWLIYYPIVALNLTFGVFVFCYALSRAYGHNLVSSADTHILFAGVVALILIALAKFFTRPRPSSYVSSLLNLTAIFTAVIALMALDNLITGENQNTYLEYSNTLSDVLKGFWCLAHFGFVAYLALLPFLWFFFLQRRKGLLLGFALTFLLIRFWLVFISTVWLVVLSFLSHGGKTGDLLSTFSFHMHFLSIWWFEVAVIAATFAFSFLAYRLQPRTARDASPPGQSRTAGAASAPKPFPRLIAPSVFPSVAIFLSVTALAAYGSCTQPQLLPNLLRDYLNPICGYVDLATNTIVNNAVLLLGVVLLLVQLAHSGFAPVLDVVNFFKSDHGHRRANPLSALASIWAYSPVSRQNLRNALGERLEAQMSDMTSRFGRFDRVVFVAHSLGSIIALDYIAALRKNPNSSGHVDIELVTMGSPLEHIFRHYMPHSYPNAAAFAERHELKWTNIYRADDYIGTHITVAPNERIEEFPLDPGGHQDYLNDEKVGHIIRERYF